MEHSIVMNYSGNGYSLILTTFEFNAEGERVIIESNVYVDKTYEECITLINEM
jgi:hypothetical protein